MPDLAPLLRQTLVAAPPALAILLGTIALNMLVGRALHFVAERASLADEAFAPIGRLLRWVVNVAAVVLLLGMLGFNLGGLWAMMATVLGMVAIGFVAVWSVLSNVLCTIIILLYRPFDVGDEIEIAGEPIQGRVAALNFLYTTLHTSDGALLQIPNNLFFQKVIKRRRVGVRSSSATRLRATLPPVADPASEVATAQPAR